MLEGVELLSGVGVLRVGVFRGGDVGKRDSEALKEEEGRILVLLIYVFDYFLFFVDEAEMDWDFIFSMAFSHLLRPAVFFFFFLGIFPLFPLRLYL